MLIEELAKDGYDQKLLTRKNADLAKRVQGIPKLNIVEIPKPYLFSLKEIKDSTLIHAHETKAAQFSLFANLFYKIPYIITRRVEFKIKANFFNRAMYKRASFVVALSDVIKKETLKISNDINTIIIPSAYSGLELDKTKIEEIKNRFKGKFLIGNIGELDNKTKGQYYLIEAAKRFQKSHPEFHFVFLGRGVDEQNYKEQAKNLTNITFEGFVDNVGDYIEAFDLFVFPSLKEGLGSILLDVKRAKVPIIASETGGIPDIVQNNYNGILIPPESSDSIYESILEFYRNKPKAKLFAQRAYDEIEKYSPTNLAKKYKNLYSKIV